METSTPQKAPRVPPGPNSLAALAAKLRAEHSQGSPHDPIELLNLAGCKLEGIEALLSTLRDVLEDIAFVDSVVCKQEATNSAVKHANHGLTLLYVLDGQVKDAARDLHVGESLLLKAKVSEYMKNGGLAAVEAYAARQGNG